MVLVVTAAVVVAGLWFSRAAREPLVVYCAHDSIYADDVLRDFERATGIPVEVRYDTEATKSLGLQQLIQRERSAPRCDVFWNNELLGTLDLQADGLLEPYQGTGWNRMPEQFRDPEGYWVGFGARLRVWLVNTGQMAVDQDAIDGMLSLETARVCMAQPMFGTTLTHYAVLEAAWGSDRLQAWHRELRQRGLREVAGNGLSKDLVAAGTCDCGWTDTDDAFLALDAGAPVGMWPARVDGKTIAIPNSVAIIRGTRQRSAAERLVDFLTSAETELRLARSTARQIPLGPVDAAQLPADVAKLLPWGRDSLDLRGLLPARQSCLEWLKREYAP